MANNLKEREFHFIYKTTNLINGKYYIGMHSTNCLKDGYLGSGTYLRRSIKKYGRNNFQIEILSFCKDREELIEKEKELVHEGLVEDPSCMNLRLGGGNSGYGFLNKKHSEETKLKQRLAKLGNKNSKGNYNRCGVSHTKETKAKMSLSHQKIQELKDLTRTPEQLKFRERQKKKKARTYVRELKPKVIRLSREEAQRGNTNAKGSIRTEAMLEVQRKLKVGNQYAKGSIRTEAMRQVARENNLRVWVERKLKQSQLKEQNEKNINNDGTNDVSGESFNHK